VPIHNNQQIYSSQKTIDVRQEISDLSAEYEKLYKKEAPNTEHQRVRNISTAHRERII
jgi:cell division protein FtsL